MQTLEITESFFLSSLGNKIKSRRINSGISLETLSVRSCICSENLKGIESGTHSVNIEDFVKITKSLNINTYAWLDEIQ